MRAVSIFLVTVMLVMVVIYDALNCSNAYAYTIKQESIEKEMQYEIKKKIKQIEKVIERSEKKRKEKKKLIRENKKVNKKVNNDNFTNTYKNDEDFTNNIHNDEWRSLGQFYITHYTPAIEENGGYNGTSLGRPIIPGRTIAVDPNIISYDSEVMINGHVYIAEDCGGAIKGNRIDIAVPEGEADDYGVYYAEVKIR